MSVADLPRLAVIGDVVPERAAGGQLLLYRLLTNYPADRLVVVYGPQAGMTPAADRRLPGVRYALYDRLPLPRRLYTTRFSGPTLVASVPFCRIYSAGLWTTLGDFRPDVLLTVPQGLLWLTAAATARRNNVPVALVCHDDWVRLLFAPRRADPYLHRVFGAEYRAADERLAVCTRMADVYRADHGAEANVLWPSRGPDSPVPRLRVRPNAGRLTVLYAGSLFRNAYTHLELVADALGDSGEVLVFSSQPLGSLASRANVRYGGFISPAELAERAATEADVLLVSVDFGPGEQRVACTSFPSKIADYTAIGLPILIVAPVYSSAADWANEYSGVAELVTEPTFDAVGAALRRLAADPVRRAAIAERALSVGEELFSFTAAERQFLAVMHKAAGRLA